jgi:hypothetical protein
MFGLGKKPSSRDKKFSETLIKVLGLRVPKSSKWSGNLKNFGNGGRKRVHDDARVYLTTCTKMEELLYRITWKFHGEMH